MRFLAKIGVVLLCGVASGAVPMMPADAWTPLFDGKDLSGWKNNGAEKWWVENGEILAQSAANKYGYLTTEKTYRDFLLRVKFKCDGKGNYGVFLRSRIIGEGENGPDIEGTQVEVDPDRDTGGIYESGGRGWVARGTEQSARAIKPHDWNQLEIAIEGRHVVTRLNGLQIVDWRDPAPRFFDGVIGLQLHTGGGARIHWKDIEIQELK
ncbi:MAG: DUF1080 domain-containing protein [Acidobacteriia bacterium]|nr:DUF1080 domain-containing protein [Terriglobia bacterium]